MNYLGIDIEKNRRGVWNLGIGLFTGKRMLSGFNIMIEETFSTNENDGYGAKYYKTRERINKSRNVVWVQTLKQADVLAATIMQGWKWSKSFGYNSSTFDLNVIAPDFPLTHALLVAKPHIDLMPLAVHYLTSRKDYYEFWKVCVSLDLTHEGNADYRKFSAELILNYLVWRFNHNKGRTFKYQKEEHIGLEDLMDFEYRILVYFRDVLKKKRNGVKAEGFQKWKHS